MQLAESIWNVTHSNKVRYLLVGGSSVLIEYGLFLLLVNIFDIGAVRANVVSFLVGFFYSFMFHCFWTFRGKHVHGAKRQFISYATLAAINVVATSLLIAVQVDIFHIPDFMAKLACMALVVVWNYLLLNRVIFKRVN